MESNSQLYKGILEGCILMIIARGTTYGYHIVMQLNEYHFTNVKEGTIYAVLIRLEKKQYIIGKFQSTPLGPNRKYYSITDSGLQYLQEFIVSWNQLYKSVNFIIGEMEDVFE